MCKGKKVLFFLLVLGISALSSALGAEDNIFYRGLRPMGMGGAFISVADDENTRNWNPAGMMYLPGMNLSFQIQGRASDDVVSSVSDISNMIDAYDEINNDTTDFWSNPKTNDFYEKYIKGWMDKKIVFNIDGGFDLVLPKARKKVMTFGLGFYAKTKTNIWLNQTGLSAMGFPFSLIDDQMLYNINLDFVPSFSGAYKFSSVVPTFVSGGKRDLSVGLTFKYIMRYKISNESSPYNVKELIDGKRADGTVIDLAKDAKNLVDHPGSGVGFDIGAITELTDYMRVGMVLQDVGTKITYDSAAIPADDIPMNVRIGTTFYPFKYLYPDSQRKNFDVIISADLDNLTGDARENSDLMDKVHLGAEMKFSLFKNFLSLGLRGGTNQGFPTYGVTLHGLWILQLDYTAYGDEFADYHNAAFSIIF
ncbi:MAG: hypothetical protein AB1498_06605 [bacterium]